MRPSNESLSTTAILMTRRLVEQPPEPSWPVGLTLETIKCSNAAEAHAIMELSYRGGGGQVPPFTEWWPSISGDAEFDASVCFLARDRAARPVAFIHCWSSAFVKDLVVHPNFRRRGLGRDLLLHAFAIFRARGVGEVRLKVRPDNLVAIALYRRVGMVSAEC